MKLLDGRVVKDKIFSDLRDKLVGIDKKLSFVVIQIGDDLVDDIYIRSKEKMASSLGYDFNLVKLSDSVSEEEVVEVIDKYNRDDNVDGIMIELPIPKNLDYDYIRNVIDPSKDIDGVTDINMGRLITGNEGIRSCTALGVVKLLKYYDISLVGKNITIVGRSNLVGKPLSNLLINEGATVTVCHSKTSNLSFYTKNADILVACVGKAGFVTRDMVKEDSVIVDVGTNVVDGKLCGDVNFDDVKDIVSYITPVPGGVGQVTTAILGENIYKCYRNKKI